MTQTTPQTPDDWLELAPHTYVRSSPGWGMNSGLVIGQERALLVDTGAGPAQAKALLDGVRKLTNLPVIAVNTHAHYDHFFGNAYLMDNGVEEIWATSDCARTISDSGEEQRSSVAAVEPAMAAGTGPGTAIVVPQKLVDGAPVDLDLGGMSVTLFHLGRGHTDHDLLVGAPDVLFAGDLVEQGADPNFGDSYPMEWIRTLGKIIALEDLYSTVVPGHGKPVDMAFVTTQMNKMRTAVAVTRSAMDQASTDMTKAIPILPYGPEQSRALLTRLRTLARWKWLKQ